MTASLASAASAARTARTARLVAGRSCLSDAGPSTGPSWLGKYVVAVRSRPVRDRTVSRFIGARSSAAQVPRVALCKAGPRNQSTARMASRLALIDRGGRLVSPPRRSPHAVPRAALGQEGRRGAEPRQPRAGSFNCARRRPSPPRPRRTRRGGRAAAPRAGPMLSRGETVRARAEGDRARGARHRRAGTAAGALRRRARVPGWPCVSITGEDALALVAMEMLAADGVLAISACRWRAARRSCD